MLVGRHASKAVKGLFQMLSILICLYKRGLGTLFFFLQVLTFVIFSPANSYHMENYHIYII